MRHYLTVLAALGLAVLCGCDLPRPFEGDRPGARSRLLRLRDTNSVTINPIEGEPRATALGLGAALATALQKLEIPASQQTTGRESYRLFARIQLAPPVMPEDEPEPPRADRSRRGSRVRQSPPPPLPPQGAALIIRLELRDHDDRVIGERAERVVAPEREWQEGAAAAVAKLAAASAAQLRPMLQEEGPAEAPSLIGSAAPEGAGPGDGAEPKAAPGNRRVQIRPVKDAPGDGAQALSRAMGAALTGRNLELVVASAPKPDIVIAGEVTIDKPQGGMQAIKIVWRVLQADGAEIGNVGQENAIPAGALDKSWGDVANIVAGSAADGIMQLIARAPPAAAQPGGGPTGPAQTKTAQPGSQRPAAPATGAAEGAPDTQEAVPATDSGGPARLNPAKPAPVVETALPPVPADTAAQKPAGATEAPSTTPASPAQEPSKPEAAPAAPPAEPPAPSPVVDAPPAAGKPSDAPPPNAPTPEKPDAAGRPQATAGPGNPAPDRPASPPEAGPPPPGVPQPNGLLDPF